MKTIPESDAVIVNSIFSNSTMFSGLFSSVNNLIRQKNTLCKADKIISESEIVSREAAVNTGRETGQSAGPGGIYQNWETPGGTRRFDRFVLDTSAYNLQ